jgi:hypothetical protein
LIAYDAMLMVRPRPLTRFHLYRQLNNEALARDDMDTVRLFATGCLAVALAAGLTGAVTGTHQLVSAASVIMIISAITFVIVIAVKTLAGR